MSEKTNTNTNATSITPNQKKQYRFKKGKSFSFTWNNYPSNYREIFNKYKDKIKYLVTGEETSKTGTPHLQGYIKFHEYTTDLATAKKFGNCHVELTKGSDIDNDNYCRGIGETAKKHGKEPNIPEKIFTIGTFENESGKRNDLIRIKEDFKLGLPLKDIIDKCETVQGLIAVEKYAKYVETSRKYTSDFKFIWIYGPTETGKTKYVITKLFKEEYENGDIYMAMHSARWWDGYDKQRILLIDDFRDSYCTFSNLLQICQPIEYRVEFKGGTRQLLATTIIITSCHSPVDVYNNLSENRNQLLRRITQLLHFYDLDYYKDETIQIKEYVKTLKQTDTKKELSFLESINNLGLICEETYKTINDKITPQTENGKENEKENGKDIKLDEPKRKVNRRQNREIESEFVINL